MVTGDVSLILTYKASLTAEDGIEVNEGNSLTIYGQTKGTGKLTAITHSDSAGIGGGNNKAAGSVTIHGGMITAQGRESENGWSHNAAGIDGGKEGEGEM